MRTAVPRAGPLAWLDSLQASHLKRLAFLTGINSTGTKTEIRGLLQESLVKPRYPRDNARVLSVDMGVKNLAFCLFDIRQQRWASKQSPAVQLLEWKRLDLTARPMSQASDRYNDSDASVRSNSVTMEEDIPSSEDDPPVAKQTNMYSPSQLSRVAYRLASEFVKYRPDIILIERQRFRSGGSPAIQEWTVRVNMLESMLWACLETMKHENSGETASPTVVEMSPRRIGSYWLGQDKDAPIAPVDVAHQLEGTKSKVDMTEMAKSKRSLEKKDKIALARSWLQPERRQLEFVPTLDSLVSVFRPQSRFTTPSSPKRRKKKDFESQPMVIPTADTEPAIETVTKLGKLDDLADCLVQGVTFALWEENRRKVLEYGASLTLGG